MALLATGAGGIAADEAWTRALADELLSGASAGLPLYLYLEPDTLDRVARSLCLSGDAKRALATAVRERLTHSDRGSPFHYWDLETSRWERAGKVGAPPYLALLALLTNAAEMMVGDAEHASHNYYARLGELLDLSADQADRLRRHFAATVGFWLSFNDWLEDWEGEKGWPTARVHDRRVFIGYPLSQALVRRQDRRALHTAFERYGLAPRRRIGASEMAEYLGDWIQRGASPRNLTRMWGDNTARRRITQIACDELEHWNGELAAGRAQQEGAEARLASGRLEWFAELSLAPVPTIELYLITRQDPEVVAGAYRLDDSRVDHAGHAALAECGSDLRLERLPGIAWACLEPWARVGVTSLFSGAVGLIKVGEPSRCLVRSPAPILILEQDEAEGRYREVRRAQLLEPSLVLVHEGMTAAAEKHLREHARNGWSKLTSSSLRNLPKGWVAFIDVMMITPADEASAGMLAPLCAAPSTAICLSGGLRLGQNTWHVSRPPEVLAAVDNEGRFWLSATARNASEPSNRRELGTHLGRAAVGLEPLGLEGGDHEIRMVRRTPQGEARVVQIAGFRLRSADQPRPVGVRGEKARRHDLSHGFGLISSAGNSAEDDSLVGCVLRLQGGAYPLMLAPGPPLVLAAKPEKTNASFRRVTRVDEEKFEQSCAVRGYHHWDCEEGYLGDDYRTLKRQVCRTCFREEWSRNRGVRPRAPANRRPATTTRMRLSDIPRYKHLHATTTEAFDLLLDAVSYVTAGSWDRFRNLATSLCTEDGFAWRAARMLSALGHLDLEIDRRNGRVCAWQVAPACLVESTTGSWILAGARSGRLVDSLREHITMSGGTVDARTDNQGPTVIKIKFPDAGRIPDLSEQPTPFGPGIALAPSFSSRLTSALLPLSSVVPCMPELQVGSGEHERFDIQQGTWTSAKHDTGGAYRVDHRGLNYGFTSSTDVPLHRMRVGDVHLIKYLAAAEAGISLLEHDSARSTLLVPLGASLPGLFERAAVMCSGEPPRFRSDCGLLEYGGVPAEIAEALQRRLHA